MYLYLIGRTDRRGIKHISSRELGPNKLRVNVLFGKKTQNTLKTRPMYNTILNQDSKDNQPGCLRERPHIMFGDQDTQFLPP